MNHFIYCYAGNKRNEYKYFKDYIKLEGVKNIIEPFCGSSAISFNIWLENKDKYNYYLNDNSEKLYNVYKLIKEEDPEIILKKINDIKNKIKNKEDYCNLYKSNYDVYEYIVLVKRSSFRFGIYKEDTKSNYKFSKLQLLFFEFIKSPNVFISNNDWSIPFNIFKDDKESLIFLDPPYLSLCNDFYQNKTTNIYEYLYYNNISNFKSHIYLILENIWIIKLLFKHNNLLYSYDKIYEVSKKKTEHIIIYNS